MSAARVFFLKPNSLAYHSHLLKSKSDELTSAKNHDNYCDSCMTTWATAARWIFREMKKQTISNERIQLYAPQPVASVLVTIIDRVEGLPTQRKQAQKSLTKVKGNRDRSFSPH